MDGADLEIKMNKISTLLHRQSPEHGFSIPGVNGYAGEQDGSHAVLTRIYWFDSRQEADEEFPGGVPDYVRLHWASYRPGRGWEAVFGWWSDQPTEDDGNPLTHLSSRN